MVLICPYCDTEINEKMIEQEDGCCPECGAIITASTVLTEGDDDEYDEEFDEEEDREDGDFDEFDEEMDEYSDK